MNGMKKWILCAMCAVMLCLFACGCSAEALGENEYIGENPNGACGVIRVKVTMDGDKIAKIKIIEQHETRDIGTIAMMELADKMKKTNTIELDNISGATLSCVAFKAAVRQAVETANGFDPAAGVVLGENEYLGISDHALGGRMMVKVTVEDGKMTAIDILESHETDGIGVPAQETMKARMLEANSADVDGISGATVTCKAICEAVAQALEQAGK